MRDIKFRGKEIDTGKWVFGFYLEQDICNMGSKNTKRDLLIKDAGVIVQNSKCNSGTVIDKKTIGQYTGLKDENGKEIYEGDIIEFSYDMFIGNFNTFIAKGKVIFEEGAFYVEVFENERTTKDEAYLLYSINLDTIELMGNIYDNLELLEEKE